MACSQSSQSFQNQSSFIIRHALLRLEIQRFIKAGRREILAVQEIEFYWSERRRPSFQILTLGLFCPDGKTSHALPAETFWRSIANRQMRGARAIPRKTGRNQKAIKVDLKEQITLTTWPPIFQTSDKPTQDWETFAKRVTGITSRRYDGAHCATLNGREHSLLHMKITAANTTLRLPQA